MAKGALDFSEYDALSALDTIHDLASVIAQMSGGYSPDNKGKIIHSELLNTTPYFWRRQSSGGWTGGWNATYGYGVGGGYRIGVNDGAATAYHALVAEFVKPPGNTMGVSVYVAPEKLDHNVRVGFVYPYLAQYIFMGIELNFVTGKANMVGVSGYRHEICDIPGEPSDFGQFIPVKVVINFSATLAYYESCVIGDRRFRLCMDSGDIVTGHGKQNIQAHIGCYRNGTSLARSNIDNILITCNEVEYDLPCNWGHTEIEE